LQALRAEAEKSSPQTSSEAKAERSSNIKRKVRRVSLVNPLLILGARFDLELILPENRYRGDLFGITPGHIVKQSLHPMTDGSKERRHG